MIPYFKSFICLLFLFTIHIALAQSAMNKVTFSFSSLHPISNFSDYSIANEKSGGAATGYGFHLGYERFLKPKFSIVGQFYYYKNPLNLSKVENIYNQQTYFIFNNPTPINPWTFAKSSWTTQGLQLGFAKYFSLNNKNSLFFGLTPLMGLAIISSPALEGSSITPTTEAKFTQNSATKATTSFQLKSGFLYKINEHFTIDLDAFYFATKNFQLTELTENFMGVINNPSSIIAWGESNTTSVKQKVDIIGIYIGLGYLF